MNAMSKHARLTAARALVQENPVLLGIAGIGFFVSFQTIAGLARAQRMPGWPVLYPLLIDAAILGFIIESRKAIDDGRSDLVPRALAWLFAGFTVYVNAHGSPARDWLGVSLHVAAPSLWVAFLELTRWRKLRKAAALRQDRIPRARWLAAPLRTWAMRRRMILHNVTSYAEASAREDARMLGMDLAAAVFGKRWKRDAPVLLRHHLLAGTLPADVATAAAERSRELPDAVEAWITGASARRDKAAARARQQRAAIDGQPAQSHDGQKTVRGGKRKSVSATARKRAQVTRLLTVSPEMSLAEVARKAGVSESTVVRVKREMPRALHPVREAMGD